MVTIQRTKQAYQEPMIECPFNPLHKVSEKAFEAHLINKCEDYKRKKDDYEKCPYSKYHYILKIKIDDHLRTCDKRPSSVRKSNNCTKELDQIKIKDDIIAKQFGKKSQKPRNEISNSLYENEEVKENIKSKRPRNRKKNKIKEDDFDKSYTIHYGAQAEKLKPENPDEEEKEFDWAGEVEKEMAKYIEEQIASKKQQEFEEPENNDLDISGISHLSSLQRSSKFK